MRERVADVIVPITGGRLDMLAKATATLHRAVEVQAYVWGVGRNRIAIFGPLRRTVGGVGMLVYRLKRLKVRRASIWTTGRPRGRTFGTARLQWLICDERAGMDVCGGYCEPA